MKEISEDTKSVIIDMLNSEAWHVFEAMINEQVKNLRILATQKSTPTEDRQWYSAEAQGRENSIAEIKEISNYKLI